MAQLALTMSLLFSYVLAVASTQSVVERPIERRRPMLRNEREAFEEGERYAPSTQDSDDMLADYDYQPAGVDDRDRDPPPQRENFVQKKDAWRKKRDMDEGAAGLYEEEARVEDTSAVSRRMDQMQKRIDQLETQLGQFKAGVKGDASRIPTTMDDNWNFHQRSMAERVRYLEQKVDGASNWLSDPQLYEKLQLECKNMTNLGTDHRVCFDNFAQRQQPRGVSVSSHKNCIVYDMGIRANPDFGVKMMTDYGCSVRAYDPSPMSRKWWSGEGATGPEQRSMLNKLKAAGPQKYDFHSVGAGGQDGPFTLYEYNWNQVSIFHAENDHTNAERQTGAPDRPPRHFSLNALTLPTMMRNNQDTYIDVLKLDIEGSEYMFMQDMFDRMGCPPVGQFALEWHAFSNDPRYGSPPEINTLHNMLTACGYKMFFNHEHWRNEAGVATDENGHESTSNRKLPAMRYALASYCKDCVPAEQDVQMGGNVGPHAPNVM